MITRNFANMPGDISLLGFGCMRLPQNSENNADIDYETGQKMVDYAIANGVTYFDTAYMYHAGKSEKFIGQALKKYPRDSFYLADKLPVINMKSKQDVEDTFNEQLERCGVEYFDFYLAHSLDKEKMVKMREYDIYNQLLQKKKEGKIKHLGFSFHDDPPVLQEILDAYDWDFCQIQLNYLDWDLIGSKDMYEMVEKAGIPAIVMEPVRGGALNTLNEEAVAALTEYHPDKTPASWAVRWVAGLPNVLTILSGMSNLAQVEDNVKTINDFTPITKEEQGVLDSALKIYKDANTVPCTACRYCMDCPFGVDIPGVFQVYNEYKLGKNDFMFGGQYEDLGKEHQASACVACGACVPKCPQAIPIPERMAQINEVWQKRQQ